MIEDIIRVGSGDNSSYVIPVPNDSLALLIGKNADTLKMLKNMSGVDRIQIANEGTSGSNNRSMFIYGSM